MEQDDLVLVVFQMLKRLKHGLVVVEAVEHVSENDHEAAAVCHLCNLMQALRR